MQAGKKHSYQDKYICKVWNLMPHLTVHQTDLCEPAFPCLSALSGFIEEKPNWNCVRDFGL